MQDAWLTGAEPDCCDDRGDDDRIGVELDRAFDVTETLGGEFEVFAAAVVDTEGGNNPSSEILSEDEGFSVADGAIAIKALLVVDCCGAVALTPNPVLR